VVFIDYLKTAKVLIKFSSFLRHISVTDNMRENCYKLLLHFSCATSWFYKVRRNAYMAVGAKEKLNKNHKDVVKSKSLLQ
jgi:hypothetical protein